MSLDRALKTRIKTQAKLVSREISPRAGNLALLDRVLPVSERLLVGRTPVDLSRRTVLVFHDLEPNKNWAHACEYLLYDADSGELYERLPAALPPPLFLRRGAAVEAFHTPVKLKPSAARRARFQKRIPLLTNALPVATGQRYAILFSGNSNNRHVNDLEFLYRTLIDVYNFPAANITVLNHDGTVNYYLNHTFQTPANVGNWPGDNTAYRMAVDGAGTRAEMQAAFNDLATRIQPEDLLFIHTNNHGGSRAADCTEWNSACGESDYCLYEYDTTWNPYNAADFIADMSVLPPFEVLLVMMEQCHAGGFIQPILDNSPAKWTYVATAVPADHHSDGGADFDPYAEDWIAAIAGQHADGTAPTQAVDGDADSRVSAAEASTYTNAAPSGGDTPTVGESPAGVGANIYLGLPRHDLFLRDNLQDHGREPLVDGGISCSPDIIVYNQELLDPDATLGTAGALAQDTLGQPVEKGQNNYIYLRIHNRGTEATGGRAKVYWSETSTFPTPSAWHLIGEIDLPNIAPSEMNVVGPLEWSGVPEQGHYCFIGLVESGDDPAPDPAAITSLDAYYRVIRESNNATWKNFDVVNLFKDSENSVDFRIQGWKKIPLEASLRLDLSELPAGVEVRLRLLKRLVAGAIPEHAVQEQESTLYRRYRLDAGSVAWLRGLSLKPSESTEARLEFVIPATVTDGAYRLSIAQLIDGKEMGRISRLLAVGEHAYMANTNTGEVHVPACEWAARVSPRHRLAYKELERAIKHGYNGCRYCLPEFSTD